MTMELQISIDGHDWENDLHFSYRLPVNMSLFEKHPEAINYHIEGARRELEHSYKKALIEKKKHLKVIR